jgi:RNA polymerase sigma-70 factor (ECF subfamily)
MLMDRHRDRAYRLALRITRSPEDAEDVAQQAFVRAWHALGQFRGESAFGTWLYRIVARRALDRASQTKARQTRELDVDAAGLTLVAAAGEGRDGILARRLERLMTRLTAGQRAVVTLYYWEESRVDEIAATLGMPENTVKTHLRRARATLREAWLATEGEP